MEEKGIISMSIKELKRLHIIQKINERAIKQKKAAELLDLSTRQVRRILHEFRSEGAGGLVHKARGRSSNRKHPQRFKTKVLRLYETQYLGFGPTLACEKLLERNKIALGRETLRRWLLEEGLWTIQKKARSHHIWRERKECFGEMVQMDGSHHDWLEGRGPKLVLMGYIDDATSEVYGRFYDYEGTLPAMDSFFRYLRRYGVPMSIYLDRHSTYKSTGKPTVDEELKGIKPKSQFERALDDLSVTVIHAYSPQAKGRIERQFGTFQDRLVKEMRLRMIKTKEEANRFLESYLPKYNRQFRRSPKREINLHRQAPGVSVLKRILSIQECCELRGDNTVRRMKKLYLVEEDWKGPRPKMIQLEERIDGGFYFMNQDKMLQVREVKEAPRADQRPSFRKKPPIPSKDHPWRKFSLRPSGYRHINNHLQKEESSKEEKEPLLVSS